MVPSVDAIISPGYRAEQVRLHAEPRGYGGRGDKWSDTVVGLLSLYGCRSVLDYGCGQGALLRAVRREVSGVALSEFDPAIPGKDTLPGQADLVVCTDVLEHVESDRIWMVMGHLAWLTRRACLLVVSLVETSKTLSDGRQAHISLHAATWWEGQVAAHGFTVARELNVKPEKQWAVVLVRRGA